MSITFSKNHSHWQLASCAPITAGLAFCCLLTACKTTPAVDDAALSRAVQTQLAGDSSLSGLAVQSNVQKGVVVLNGTVNNDAQRTIAARDAAGVAGVKEVISQLTVAGTLPVNQVPPVQAVTVLPQAPIPVPVRPITSTLAPVTPVQTRAERLRQQREDAQRNQQQDRYNQQQARNNQPPVPAPIERVAPVPVAPPPPAFRNVTVASGSTVSVRITQSLDSATTQAGDAFSGVLSSDVLVDGLVALPAGSAVTGQVDQVHEAGHFKGASLLTVSLSGISRRGDRMTVTSEPYTVQGKGRGTNTAEKVGGGAAVGAILGGIFGGGKGAAIGAGAGGGLGAGAQAVTRGQQVQIPSESIVRFHLTTPVTVRVRTDGAAAQQGDLQRRGNNSNN